MDILLLKSHRTVVAKQTRWCRPTMLPLIGNMLSGYLLLLLSIGNINAAAARTEKAQLQPIAQRQEQSACSAPLNGCGYGLWNEESCECDCIPDHCFDEIFLSCIFSPGSCPNAFEGCTQYVNCPYFANPMVGKCESSDTIAPGVYTIFRTAEECCTANYSDSPDCIPTAPPTASPSPSPKTIDTIESTPQTKPSQTEPTIELTPISINFYNLPPHFELDYEKRGNIEETIRNTLTSTSDDFNATIVSLEIVDDISSLFSAQDEKLSVILHITVTGPIVPPGVVHRAFINTLHKQLYEISNTLKGEWGPESYINSVILDVDGVQTTVAPSPKPTAFNGVIAVPNNADGGSRSLPRWSVALLVILIAMFFGGLIVWHRRRDKDRKMPPPSRNSYFEDEMSDAPSKITNDLSPDQSSNQSGFMGMEAISFQYLSSMRSNNFSQSRRSSTGTNFHESRQSQMSFQPRRNSMDNNFDKSRQNFQPQQHNKGINFDESRRSKMSIDFHQSQESNMDKSMIRSSNPLRQTDQSIIEENTSQIEPEGTKSFEQSMRFTDSAMNINQIPLAQQEESGDESSVDRDMSPAFWKVGQNPDGVQMLNQQTTRNRGNRVAKSAEEEKLEESGYDGGRSSLFNVNDDSSSQDDSSDESSTDEGNVLGLLYYDGASSAGESEARESRRSRRSGRTSRSRHSSGKSSTGKSSRNRSKSSRSQKSRRKKAKRLSQVTEEAGHKQQHTRESQAYGGNVPGGSQQDHAFVTKPIRGDNLRGSIVYANSSNSPSVQHMDLDENEFESNEYAGRGCADQSAFSHGSTIKTADSHRKRWQEDHAESFNSTCECTTDLNNNTEVKP